MNQANSTLHHISWRNSERTTPGESYLSHKWLCMPHRVVFPGLLELTVSLLQNCPRQKEVGLRPVLWSEHYLGMLVVTHQSSVCIPAQEISWAQTTNHQGLKGSSSSLSPAPLNRWGNWGPKKSKYIVEVTWQSRDSALFSYISACVNENVQTKKCFKPTPGQCP